MTTIGILGYGYWGSNSARVFRQLPDCKLGLIYEPDPERREKLVSEQGAEFVADSEDQVIESSDIDAVCIASIPEVHYEQTKRVLEADKHALVEKPFVLSSERARELSEVAKEHRRVLMVALIFLYNPRTIRMKEYVDQGELGDVHHMYSLRTSFGPRIREDINVVWDYAIHDVYMAHHLVPGEIQTVRATGQAAIKPDIIDTVFIEMRTAEAPIHIHCSWNDPLTRRETVLIGSTKMMRNNEMDISQRLTVYYRGFEPMQGIDEYGNVDLRRFDEGAFPLDVSETEPLKLQCEDFLRAVREGRRPLADAKMGIRTVATIEAIHQSLNNDGETVSIPL